MNPWLSFVLGVGTGVVIAYPVGYLRERGRHRADLANKRAEAKRSRKKTERAAAERQREKDRRDAERAEEVERLAPERIGRRFAWRTPEPDKPDTVWSVIAVDADDPTRRVIITRVDDEGMPADWRGRTSIEWATLTMPADEQRRATSRHGRDGFVEFEEVEPDRPGGDETGGGGSPEPAASGDTAVTQRDGNG